MKLTPPPRHEASPPKLFGGGPHSQSMLQGGSDMDWKPIRKLKIIGLVIILAGSFFVGCSEQRWHPTDPRLDTPDPADVQVVERWEIGVGVEVQ